MSKATFETLKAYQLSELLADRVWSIVARWPQFEKETMGIQLIRAVDSIGANLAEGVGRYSHMDNRRFARMARGSLFEVRHWLRRAWARKCLNKQEAAELATIIDELSKVLAGYLRALTRSITTASVRGTN
jgi:four helix bundle protein